MRRPTQPPLDTSSAAVLGLLGVLGYVLLLGWGIANWSWDEYGGLLVVPVLLAVSVPVLLRLGRATPEVGPGVLVLALVLKLASGGARYLQSYVIAGGADAERYHDAGIRISSALRSGAPWVVEGPWPGTGFMEAVAGYAYWVVGTSRLGGYFFFSWIAFWGLVLYTRAFRTAFPDAHVRRYTLLVLFLPSLLFWPSSIGKETWMTLMLGLTALGAARVYRYRADGFLLLAAGITGAIMVRPHMAVLLFGGIAVGYLARPLKPGAALAPVIKAGGIVVLGLAGLAVLLQAEAFFDTKGGDATAARDEAQRRTSQGGSEFEATPVTSPLQLPWGYVTVLLRPFPYEASSLESLVASAEGLLLVYLLWRFRDSVRAFPRLVLRQPYVAFCATYTTLFVIAFSSFGNFGILTRQRVQVFPFVLVLLALPAVRQVQQRRRTARFQQQPVLAEVSRRQSVGAAGGGR